MAAITIYVSLAIAKAADVSIGLVLAALRRSNSNGSFHPKPQGRSRLMFYSPENTSGHHPTQFSPAEMGQAR
jgi:hypothetical protein